MDSEKLTEQRNLGGIPYLRSSNNLNQYTEKSLWFFTIVFLYPVATESISSVPRYPDLEHVYQSFGIALCWLDETIWVEHIKFQFSFPRTLPSLRV